MAELKPDIIINAGTAGGFKSFGMGIGDAVISTVFKYHDRRIPLPGFEAYGVGSYASFACNSLVKVGVYLFNVTISSNRSSDTKLA